jgi:alpha-tubulin suppressor-like RCC1 family protein
MKGISGNASVGTRTDGTLWTCGYEGFGQRGDSKTHTTSDDKYSSPVQLPGTTWGTADNKLSTAEYTVYAIKTNGTLWAWGKNTHGQLGQNESEDGGTGNYSSPVQIPGTTWSHLGTFGAGGTRAAIKTDGTLWGWGSNSRGRLAQNSTSVPTYSSPIQIPGTTWRSVYVGYEAVLATKTDGTLWAWGDNERGLCGQNNVTEYSSPTQIPGTNWSIETAQSGLEDRTVIALKTDGTAWVWGENEFGLHGLNTTHDNATYSSPVQIPGTGWTNARCSKMDFYALRDV